MKCFSELPLSAALQQRLKTHEFIVPTPVQAAAIPHGLAGRDVLATAQTGTGKTLAFLIPVLEAQAKAPHSRQPDTLVLVPTRELAMQVHEQYEALRPRSTPKAALVIGGLPERPQIASLKSGARLVVATPGRLEDFLGRRLIDLRQVAILVLDEADRMLDMGFMPSIRRILPALPRQRQTMCFSATLEASVAGLVHDAMRDPVRVELGSVLKPAESVELHAYEVSAAGKFAVLRTLLGQVQGQTLIFARTKHGTERLAKHLVREGFSAAMIHGDRSQSQRTGALNGFDQGHFKVLVATDIAARGLDVDDIAHVINYDLPNLPEDFIHRVGRTGRAGSRGLASTLVAGADIPELARFERILKLRIERRRLAQTAGAPAQATRDSLPRRTLTSLPGEVFV